MTPYKSEDCYYKLYLWGSSYKTKLSNFSHVYTILVFWGDFIHIFGRDLGTEYIVTTVFQSCPTKKCANFCMGVPMLTNKGYNDS